MKPNRKIPFAMVVLVLACIVVSMVTSDPEARPQISSHVAVSKPFQPTSIWSTVENISLSAGILDAACDVDGHAHVLFRDSTGNLYHVEHDGVAFSAYHLIGALKNCAAICVVGSTVHVVWVTMDGHVQYTRRVGTIWELNQTLPGSVDADDVAITTSGTHVWALWKDTGPRHFVLANGAGASWTSETVVNSVADDYNTGTIFYRDGRLHFAWVNGNSLYYRCYSGADVVINDLVTSSASLFANPRIALSSTDVYLAYIAQPITNGSYACRSFVNTAGTWNTPINFTRGNKYVYQMECEIAYVDGVLYFTWRSYQTSPWHAQSHYITFNGTWSSMENVTATGSTSPQLATSYKGVMIAVSHHPSGVVGLRYKYYPLAVAPCDDLQYVKGSTGNQISWFVVGRVHALGNYQVFKNGALLATAVWTNGSVISIAVDGLSTGTYNYTISAADASSNLVTDTAFVTVVEPEAEDMSGLIAAIVIPCAIGGGLLVLFLLDKKKVIDLKKIFGKMKRQPST
jgi:hypothetical protein